MSRLATSGALLGAVLLSACQPAAPATVAPVSAPTVAAPTVTATVTQTLAAGQTVELTPTPPPAPPTVVASTTTVPEPTSPASAAPTTPLLPPPASPPTPAVQPVGRSWVLSANAWGPITMGRPFPAAARTGFRWYSDAACQGAWFLSDPTRGATAMVVPAGHTKSGPVQWVAVLDPRFRTKSGLRVGSSEAQLQRNWTDGRRTGDAGWGQWRIVRGAYQMDATVVGGQVVVWEMTPTGSTIAGGLYATEWHC